MARLGLPGRVGHQPILPPKPEAVARVVASALADDLALGDPTTAGLLATATMSLLAKEPCVVCGIPIVAAVFATF